MLAAVFWCWGVISDRQTLNEELVRLHVVAASDSEADQSLKLRVRDAVLCSLEDAMTEIADPEQAKAYLAENLTRLESVANQVLQDAGCEDTAVVSLALETFDTRVYDTFTLPAGVYDTLRITIGDGEGHNWWCVVFPSLCLPATAEGFEDVAAGAGFDEALTCALAQEDGYELRFYLLDVLGRLENMLYEG